MKNAIAKSAAITKGVAILFWVPVTIAVLFSNLGVTYDGHPIPGYRYFSSWLCCIPALLSLLPNRWFVSSLISFSFALAISIGVPAFLFIQDSIDSSSLPTKGFDPFVVFYLFLLFGVLPSTMALSYWRRRVGEEVKYA